MTVDERLTQTAERRLANQAKARETFTPANMTGAARPQTPPATIGERMTETAARVQADQASAREAFRPENMAPRRPAGAVTVDGSGYFNKWHKTK